MSTMEHLTISGDIFYCLYWESGMLLDSGREIPGMLLNIRVNIKD